MVFLICHFMYFSTPHMPYTKFIEFGRLVVVSHGALKNKLAVIVDIVDINTLQVEGPEVKRQLMPVKHVILTDFVKPHTAPIDKEGVAVCKELMPEFNKSVCGKKMSSCQTRHNLKDFERFTAQKLNQIRNKKIHELMGKK